MKNYTVFGKSIQELIPQQKWNYILVFEYTNQDLNEYFKIASDDVISVELPKIENKIYTRNFQNTRRSYAISRNVSGSINLSFNLRNIYSGGSNTELKYNPFYYILNMDKMQLQQDLSYVRSEHETFRTFKNLRIKLLSNDKRIMKEIVLENTILETYHLDNLSYNDDGLVTVNLSIHYDNWYESNLVKIES